ncbi:Uu.00g004200.m01.CDS01 [Anthostomella pinea]|uniref:Uu.00g004200.m01.CDS01 n=1 Tax=Anthostomella pinea TaxID=933095 RepID=A0AAI8VJW3_9PEZI|nr:Uu.00g004200.m01.CDS01 [Anthostomella pinea]
MTQTLEDDWQKCNYLQGLLCRASVLARKMPQLTAFVLWNGGKAHDCAFICEMGNDRSSASLTWRGTWRLEFRPAEVKAWQLVASKATKPPYSA